MIRQTQPSAISSAAGLSAGTGFSGIVLLFPDGILKSVLLILAPTITIVISRGWHIVTEEVEARVADWRIRSQRKKAEGIYQALASDANADPDLKAKAKTTLEHLKTIEVEITKRRVDAILAP